MADIAVGSQWSKCEGTGIQGVSRKRYLAIASSSEVTFLKVPQKTGPKEV